MSGAMHTEPDFPELLVVCSPDQAVHFFCTGVPGTRYSTSI